MRRSYYEMSSQKTQTVPRPLNGGLNNGLDPFSIKDSQLLEEKNIQTESFPSVRPRFPRTDVGAAVTNPQFLGARKGETLLSTSGATLVSYDEGAGTWSSVGALTAQTPGDSTDYQDTTIFANGTDMKQWDGTTLSDVTDMPAMNMLETFSGRIYGANTANDSLYFSAIATPTDWTSANNAGEIEIPSSDGSVCTGLRLYNNHIIFFKENSIHELYGTNPGNYFMQTLTTKIGCVGNRAVIEVDGVLYFVAKDGVYIYGGGTVPSRISFPTIQTYFNELDMDNLDKCVTGSDGTNLYVILPIGSGDTIMLTYNIDLEVWSAEDEVDYVEFQYFDNTLYAMDSTGQMVKVKDPDGSEVVQWYFITKAFNHGDIASAKTMDKIHLTVNIPEDATMSVELSGSASQDDFVVVESFTTETDGTTVVEVIIPHSLKDRQNWHRIKVSGTGDVVVSAMQVQLRVIPKTF